MLNVLDFTKRLPGPFASYLLAKAGLSVTKVEDQDIPDPFIKKFIQGDDNFESWYKSLAENKKIFRFNKSNDLTQLKELVQNADIIIHDFHNEEKKKEHFFDLVKSPSVLLRLTSGKQGEPVHDLNALAKLHFLELHLGDLPKSNGPHYIAPPMVPLAGMCFGSGIAIKVMSLFIKAQSQNQVIAEDIGLLDEAQKFLAPFYNDHFRAAKRHKFLHNGLYPCYGIYALKDGHVVLGLIESKFWNRFIQLFKLEKNDLEPFDSNPDTTFKALSELFWNMTKGEVTECLNGESICIDVI